MRLRLLAQALLFALIITGPELFELLRFGGLSPKTFSDWDEPYYLPIAYARGRELLAWWNGTSSYEGNYLLYLFRIGPHDVLTTLVGLIGAALRIRTTVLTAVLDFAVSFIGFITFALLYRAAGFPRHHASAATVVTLFFPWMLYLPQFFHIPLPLGPGAASIPHGMYPCQPILRGIATQLSYPVFGAALLSGIYGYLGSRRALVVSGLLSGVSVYFYFFAWPSVIALMTFLLLIAPKPLRGRAADLSFYLPSALVTSLPALWILLSTHGAVMSGAASASSAGNRLNDALWYFNAEQLLLLAVLVVWMGRSKSLCGVRICVAALIAEFALMNSQKLLGVHMAPYHFPLLYLHPILSGALFASILGCFKNIDLKALPSLLVGASMLLVQAGQFKELYGKTNETEEFLSMTKAIEDSTPGDAEIMFPPSNVDSKSGKSTYHYFTIPYWIHALVERHIYAEFVGGTPEGTLPQNLLSGWIYFGELTPYVPCPAELPELPGDLMSGMMTREYWARYHLCKEIPSYLASHSLCEIYESAPFEFVVWQHTVTQSVPPSSARLLERLWRSANGEYELFRFDRSKFHSENCAAPSHPAPSGTPDQPAAAHA